jgi:hypothetical protein
MTANVAAYSSSPATKVHNPKMAEITNAPTALMRGMRDCVAGEGGRCRVGIAAGSSLKRRRSHFRPPNGCHFSLGALFAACRVLKRWSAMRFGYSRTPRDRANSPPSATPLQQAHLPRHRLSKPTRRSATASSNAVSRAGRQQSRPSAEPAVTRAGRHQSRPSAEPSSAKPAVSRAGPQQGRRLQS